MFIPGMLPIDDWLAALLLAGVLFLLDVPLRRCIPDIFIPGIFIPGIFFMSCFFAICFLPVGLLFFRDVADGLDFAFGLLIPGIFDISCCARTGTLTTSNISAIKNAQLTRELHLNRSMLFIIPPERCLTKEDQSKEKPLE
jgi:hypothetical protein